MTIEIYTRDGCDGCSQVKAIMDYYGINFVEHKLDVDVTSEWVRDHFPGRNSLPILIVNDEIFSGPKEASKVLNEYKRDVGKQLLNEEKQERDRINYRYTNEDKWENEGGAPYDVEWRKGRTKSGDMM